jgi:hypothetical protein
VENVPFACELRGRDNIFAGIRKSLNGMDRRFKERRIELTGKPAEDGATATVPWAVTYLRPGAPELRIAGRSTAELEGEQIVRLTDRFEDGIAESAGAWLRQHGADVDPSYE